MATLPQRRPVTYDVAVAAASADRTVTSIYSLDVAFVDNGVWSFTTTHSEGTWEEPGVALAYDSDAPRRSDPWPLTLQHALSSVPTNIVVDEVGTLVEMENEAGWIDAGRQALQQVDLPPEAMSSGEQMLDVDGVLADLRRNFPGTPPTGEWVRTERIAGLQTKRVEQCTVADEGPLTVWSCVGRVDGPKIGGARLHEVSSKTRVAVDRHGLVELEGTYSGTLVMLDPDNNDVLDRPIAGRRLVSRR